MRQTQEGWLQNIFVSFSNCTFCRGVIGISSDEGRTLLAAHVLLYILGHSLLNDQRRGTPPPQTQGLMGSHSHRPAGAAPRHSTAAAAFAGGSEVPSAEAVVILRPPVTTAAVAIAAAGVGGSRPATPPPKVAVAAARQRQLGGKGPIELYLSLAEASGLCGVRLPTTVRRGLNQPPVERLGASGTQGTTSGPAAAVIGGGGAAQPATVASQGGSPISVPHPDADTSLMMLFEELAELQHIIHDVLLPRMREPNLSVANGAVAQVR